MARTGRFGRLPRAAPSLASTVVALVREFNAMEDANILQAWEEGGEVDGKAVTDEILLAHFKERRDAVSKDDPLWEKWDVMLTNYTFSIEESKMSLAYAEHKVNEQQMAGFYRKWAGKLPKNSEAYRELMRSAAQFADAAARAAGGGGGRGGGGRRSGGGRGGGSQAAYDAAVLGSYDRFERGYDDAEFFLLNAAYRAGILQITDTADPDDLMDLRGGDEADHARFMELFDLIQKDPFYSDIKAALGEAGLGDLTYARFIALGDRKAQGIDSRIAIARQFGDESGAKDLIEDKTEFLMNRAIVDDINEFAAYQQMRRTVDDALARGGLSPFEVADLLGGYRTAVERLRNAATSEQSRGFFNNEFLALSGQDVTGPTAFEMNEGGIRNRNTADSSGLSTLLRTAESQIDRINRGEAFLTSGLNEEGQTAYGVISTTDARVRDTRSGAVIFNSVGAGSARSVPTFVQFRPITVQGAIGADPRTGRAQGEVSAGADALVGVTYNLNGRDYYGVYTGGEGSEMLWYSSNPFTTDRFTTNQDGSLTLTTDLTDDQLIPVPGGAPDEAVFDPLTVVQRRALDPELQFSGRFNSPVSAAYATDQAARAALLRATDAQLMDTISAVHGEGAAGLQAWQEVRAIRNTLVDSYNRRLPTEQTVMGFREARQAGVAGVRGEADLLAQPRLQRTGLSEYEEGLAVYQTRAADFERQRVEGLRHQRVVSSGRRLVQDPDRPWKVAPGLAGGAGVPNYISLSQVPEGPELTLPRFSNTPNVIPARPAGARVEPRPTAPGQWTYTRPTEPGRVTTPQPRAIAPRATPPPRPPLLPEDIEPDEPPVLKAPTLPKRTVSRTRIGTSSGGAYVL